MTDYALVGKASSGTPIWRAANIVWTARTDIPPARLTKLEAEQTLAVVTENVIRINQGEGHATTYMLEYNAAIAWLALRGIQIREQPPP